MYLKEVTITDDERCFKKGETFDLRTLTLLVGDQGCGKSTLLAAIQHQKDFISVTLDRSKIPPTGVETFYFDSESMNPRLKDPQLYTTPGGIDKGIGYLAAIKSRFGSHGEIMVSFTVDAIKQAENSIVLIDEPESGLSLKNQFALWREIEAAIGRKCQVIVATHSLVLIQAAESVLSLEHKKWMTSPDFIKSNR